MSISVWDYSDYSEDEFKMRAYKSNYNRYDGKEAWMVAVLLPEEYATWHTTVHSEEEALGNEEQFKRRAAESLDYRKRKLVKKYSILGLKEIIRAKNEEGKHYYYCDLSNSVFDKPRRIKAHTLSEMDMRLENVMEELIGSDEELLLSRAKHTRIKEKMSELMPDLQDIVWRLIDLSVFGTSVEKDFAQRKMCEMLDLSPRLESRSSREKSKEIYRSLDEQESNAERDAELFQSVFHEVLDVRNKFSANKLADIVGCSSGTISRIRSGEIRPKKDLVLKIGVAFELSESELTAFVRSAGYNFPTSRRDIIIQECLRDGYYGYDVIRHKLYQYDRDTDF